jgi:ribonucleoside-diphosphate reductase alpha chain
MRNSNTMAIAPTATISNISGCFPCIEPIYKNIYVKSNISGEFTIVNAYLVRDLKDLGLWNGDMLDQLKYYDGNISLIPQIPAELKEKYQEAFEIDPVWCLKMTAARGKWIDQSQSHNVFLKGVSGKKLSEVYQTAWRLGLKTTYYLRTLGATQIEKSTLDSSKFGFTQKREYTQPLAAQGAEQAPAVAAPTADAVVAAPAPELPTAPPLEASAGGEETPVAAPAGGNGRSLMPSRQPEAHLCRIDDPDCEACQ